MTDIAPASSTSWFQEIDRSQWRTLLASSLGWLFDGFEAFLDRRRAKKAHSDRRGSLSALFDVKRLRPA
jgi:hypothetical protein